MSRFLVIPRRKLKQFFRYITPPQIIPFYRNSLSANKILWAHAKHKSWGLQPIGWVTIKMAIRRWILRIECIMRNGSARTQQEFLNEQKRNTKFEFILTHSIVLISNSLGIYPPFKWMKCMNTMDSNLSIGFLSG